MEIVAVDPVSEERWLGRSRIPVVTVGIRDESDDGETAVFLTPEQRKALLAAASPRAALFLRGLELTGARPKELASATGVRVPGPTA